MTIEFSQRPCRLLQITTRLKDRHKLCHVTKASCWADDRFNLLKNAIQNQSIKNVITRLSIKDNFHLSYMRDLQREKSTPFWFEIWNFFFFLKVRCVKLKLPAILLCQYTITHLTIGFEAYLLWRGDSFSCIQKFGVFHCTHSSYNYFAVFIREFFTQPKLNLCTLENYSI